MADAWKRFYDAVSIKDRYNPELHRSFMPKRLWDNIIRNAGEHPRQLVAQTVAAVAATSFWRQQSVAPNAKCLDP